MASENSYIKELTPDNFETFIANASRPVVVKFYANWCGPCQRVKPTFAELAQEESDYIFAAIDVDIADAIMQKYGVHSMPTFVLFKNGAPCGIIQGGSSKEGLRLKCQNIFKQ